MRVRREASHTAKKDDYRLFAAAERESRKFVLAVVKYTGVRESRNTDLFYTSVKPRALLAHLHTLSVGLHATDDLNIQNEMQKYHEDMGGIPTYINQLEDVQK